MILFIIIITVPTYALKEKKINLFELVHNVHNTHITN